MTLRYSTESTLLPTNAPDMLDWAAAHIESRGFYDGRDGGLFGKNGTTTRYLVPSMAGAFDVAAGDGRRSSERTYDYPARLYGAGRLALDVLSDYLAGGAMPHDPHWEEENHRPFMLMDWGRREGRTRDEAAAAFRHAARLAERAQAAAVRPGRPPRPITASGLLGAQGGCGANPPAGQCRSGRAPRLTLAPARPHGGPRKLASGAGWQP
ncbi:DUF6197 family protein [Streptomyces sp. NPDC046275]|uniref:DUF6197 family protein n=1 Tax=Streptomyces sp. NPDC046275 TaxID=3157201 RepID=UPI0033CE7DD8